MIPVGRLLSSALGELPSADDLQVETHVLSCSRCAAVYASLLRLGPAVADLVRGGGASMPVTRTLAEQLDSLGLVSRRYSLEPGSVVPCSVGADDVYSLTTCRADFEGARRVDMIRATQRFSDIPFDARLGQVHILTRSSFLRTLPTMKLPIRLVAVDGQQERTLAEYTLDHTGFAQR